MFSSFDANRARDHHEINEYKYTYTYSVQRTRLLQAVCLMALDTEMMAVRVR